MAFLAAVFATLSVAAPAVAAEHDPPKFNVKSTQVRERQQPAELPRQPLVDLAP